MLLSLSQHAPDTLQEQLVRQLRALILAGDLPAGTELPSIRRLAREQKVSVITVQRSYEVLEQGGLIHAHPGRGFTVATLTEEHRQRLVLDRLRELLTPLLHQAMAEGVDRATVTRLLNEILEGDPP